LSRLSLALLPCLPKKAAEAKERYNALVDKPGLNVSVERLDFACQLVRCGSREVRTVAKYDDDPECFAYIGLTDDACVLNPNLKRLLGRQAAVF